MPLPNRNHVNRLYAMFTEIVKVNGGDQQAAFEEVVEHQTRSVRQALKSKLNVCGYKQVRV